MKAEIRKLIDGYIEAFENQDWKTLRELCSEDVVFSGARRQEGLERVIGRYQAHVSDYKTKLSNMKVGISGDGEMVWARFDMHNEFLWDGILRIGEATETLTFEKRDSQWVVTLVHFIPSPRSAAPGKRMDLKKHDQNMLEYYSRLASGPRENYFKELLSGRDVLEVACGTGDWTLEICQTANSVLATDVSNETLNVARSYTYPEGKVTFQKANAYSLDGVTGTFSAGFHSYWFSHVPLSRRDEFLNAFHSKLQPGAIVVFGDSSWEGSLVDDAGDRYDVRIARDGTEYEIIKNYPTEEELRDMLKGVASDIQYKSFGSTWAISYQLK